MSYPAQKHRCNYKTVKSGCVSPRDAVSTDFSLYSLGHQNIRKTNMCFSCHNKSDFIIIRRIPSLCCAVCNCTYFIDMGMLSQSKIPKPAANLVAALSNCRTEFQFNLKTQLVAIQISFVKGMQLRHIKRNYLT